MEVAKQIPNREDQAWPEGLSTKKLNEALGLIRVRTSEIKSKIQELESLLRSAEAEGQLIAQLIALRNNGSPVVERPQSSRRSSKSELVTGAKSPALATAIRLLEDAKRALHISELMRLLQERAVPVPGAGRQANLIAVLRSDRRIARPSRGMYGLRAWGLEDAPVRKGRKTRRRRVRNEGPPRPRPA